MYFFFFPDDGAMYDADIYDTILKMAQILWTDIMKKRKKTLFSSECWHFMQILHRFTHCLLFPKQK